MSESAGVTGKFEVNPDDPKLDEKLVELAMIELKGPNSNEFIAGAVSALQMQTIQLGSYAEYITGFLCILSEKLKFPISPLPFEEWQATKHMTEEQRNEFFQRKQQELDAATPRILRIP